MFLAIVTFKSVKASEKQVEILNNTFLLSEKIFSKEQILDQIKTLLNPLTVEIEREIPLIQKMDICDNTFRFIGLLMSKTKIKCLDLASIRTFVNNKDDPRWSPHLIYLRENNTELLDLLKRREGLITNCKLRFGSMKAEIQKHDDKIEEIVLKKIDIHPYEEETGWNSSISVDYVILHETNPYDGPSSELPVSMHDFLRTLNSLILSDMLSPIDREKFPFEYDIDYCYNLIKSELITIVGTIKITKFQDDIRDICNELTKVDESILENISVEKEKYIKNYHITTEEIW
jgi:hypothetical protein